MPHQTLTKDLSEHITLYALSALDAAAAREFAAHVDECAVCRQELEAVQSTVGVLGYGAPVVSPAPGLKARLFECIRTRPVPEVQPVSAHAAPHFASLVWELSDSAGVSFHWLRRDAVTGTAAAFVKIQPGCKYADHRHPGGEDCIVLQGGFRDRRGTYYAGDFVYYEPGSIHHDFQALDDEECILFVIAHGGLELLPSAG
jgi:anti-sigma factor ChrR (cupin superfamily)